MADSHQFPSRSVVIPQAGRPAGEMRNRRTSSISPISVFLRHPDVCLGVVGLASMGMNCMKGLLS